MAQKINPISLRLGKTNRNFDFSWFNDSNYVNLLMRDLKIQWYINLVLKKIKYSSARYLIQNLPTKVKINVFFCNTNKNRKHISKIFYLNAQKKIKKSKKKFFNTQYTGISIKQSGIFNYLAKNFTENLSNITLDKTDKILCDYKLDSMTFLKNYLKLIYFIKKHDEFYIRYFLIKYFSNKFSIIYFKKLCCYSKKTCFALQGKHLVTSLPKTSFLKNQAKLQQNALFFYIINFLFFYIYKNEKFIALNYFNFKKNNFKIITHNLNNSTNKLLEKNNNFLPNFNLISFNQKNLSFNSSTTCYVNKIAITKLKILSCLNKLQLEYRQLSNFHLSSLNFFNVNPKKKLFFTSNASCKLSSQQVFSLVNQQNLEYYNVSLINSQCFNDTYNNYCKLSESYKYYSSIYSLSLHPSKNIFENKLDKKKTKPFSYENYLNFEKLLVNTNLDQTKLKNNSNSSAALLKGKKKLILMSSPYKHHIESIVSNHFSCNINFNFFQTLNIFQNALFFIDEIVHYIEKRVPFFKIKNYILKKLTEQKHLNIKGIRVMCSGRIGGKSKKAQRSKIQNFKYGETSLHVFSSKIDFKSKNAFTSFGTLGVKVWVCYH
jgi:ribosomal protein S3